jgi:hypothetical protein
MKNEENLTQKPEDQIILLVFGRIEIFDLYVEIS